MKALVQQSEFILDRLLLQRQFGSHCHHDRIRLARGKYDNTEQNKFYRSIFVRYLTR